jgi:hypothetical protein
LKVEKSKTILGVEEKETNQIKEIRKGLTSSNVPTEMGFSAKD